MSSFVLIITWTSVADLLRRISATPKIELKLHFSNKIRRKLYRSQLYFSYFNKKSVTVDENNTQTIVFNVY